MLEIQSVSKSFPGVQALRNVSFTVQAGEVHALVGENGAGKSTLMKILSGVYPDYEGEVTFDGTRLALRNPRDAQQRGIAIIHQELNLVAELTVAENIFLGSELHTPLRHARHGAHGARNQRPARPLQPLDPTRPPGQMAACRRTTAGRGRQGARPACPPADPGRTHLGAQRSRDRTPLCRDRRPQAAGRDDDLHLAQAGRGLSHCRPRHGPARRRVHRHPPRAARPSRRS